MVHLSAPGHIEGDAEDVHRPEVVKGAPGLDELGAVISPGGAPVHGDLAIVDEGAAEGVGVPGVNRDGPVGLVDQVGVQEAFIARGSDPAVIGQSSAVLR